eukprot:5657102-Amphidinium_carterae.1
MELKYVTINGVDYSVDSPIAGTTERGTKDAAALKAERGTKTHTPTLKFQDYITIAHHDHCTVEAFQFFECLALAHTVMRDNEGGYEGPAARFQTCLGHIGESPDEEAFVKAADTLSTS